MAAHVVRTHGEDATSESNNSAVLGSSELDPRIELGNTPSMGIPDDSPCHCGDDAVTVDKEVECAWPAPRPFPSPCSSIPCPWLDVPSRPSCIGKFPSDSSSTARCVPCDSVIPITRDIFDGISETRKDSDIIIPEDTSLARPLALPSSSDDVFVPR